MVILIDNYDSFTYNLYQYMCQLGKKVTVIRNDADMNLLEREDLEAIVISPGPGTPDDSGISRDAIRKYGETVPVLGVCLGHQTIAEVYGGKVVWAPEPVHGKASILEHGGSGLFEGLTGDFSVGRYHSLIVEEMSLPDCLEINARTRDGLIMAMKHRKHPVWGVQFHPESILTPGGIKLLENFFRLAAEERAVHLQ